MLVWAFKLSLADGLGSLIDFEERKGMQESIWKTSHYMKIGFKGTYKINILTSDKDNKGEQSNEL